jgi:cobalt transporter subunit CbtB
MRVNNIFQAGDSVMQTQATQNVVESPQVTTLLASKRLQLSCAFALGIAVLFAAVFVETSSVHNAAHDMRHSQGFPCH